MQLKFVNYLIYVKFNPFRLRSQNFVIIILNNYI